MCTSVSSHLCDLCSSSLSSPPARDQTREEEEEGQTRRCMFTAFSISEQHSEGLTLFRQPIIYFCVCFLFSVPLCSVPLKNSFYGTLRSSVNNISTPEPAVWHSLSGLRPLTKAHFYGNLQLAWGKEWGEQWALLFSIGITEQKRGGKRGRKRGRFCLKGWEKCTELPHAKGRTQQKQTKPQNGRYLQLKRAEARRRRSHSRRD